MANSSTSTSQRTNFQTSMTVSVCEVGLKHFVSGSVYENILVYSGKLFLYVTRWKKTEVCVAHPKVGLEKSTCINAELHA
jgi:hypothetical protein